jgi:hypothetical protein
MRRAGGLQRINDILEILQPYLVDRVKSSTPIRFPEGTEDMPAFAKREAAFMLRRRAEQMLDEGSRIDNPTNRVIERGKSKAFRAIADLLEALNIDVREELERENSEDTAGDEEDDYHRPFMDDDGIDHTRYYSSDDRADEHRTRRVNPRRRR